MTAQPAEHIVTRDEEIQAARVALLEHIPALRVGDVWDMGATGKVTIEALESMEDEGFPWPYVRSRYERDGSVYWSGAPAFMFAKLVTRGGGETWDPAWGKL